MAGISGSSPCSFTRILLVSNPKHSARGAGSTAGWNPGTNAIAPFLAEKLKSSSSSSEVAAGAEVRNGGG
jgi:hypothetical protein